MRKRLIAGTALVAVIGLATFAATGFGLGASDDAASQRLRAPATLVLKAEPQRATPSNGVLYLANTDTLGKGTNTLTIGTCPAQTSVVNGFLSANDPQQSGRLTIRGGAPLSTTKWFVDYSLSLKTKVYFGIVCKHR
jgi:hypothetical protein